MTQLTPDTMDPPMISVTFADRVHELPIPQAQALWVDGTIDRVRMDGEDYFMASDVALVLANQGLIHEDAFVKKFGVAKGGGQCGRGWVGVKGSCKRLAKGADRAVAQKSALKDFASADRTRKQLMNAFKVQSVADLKRILPKTNMKSKDELTHAASSAWSYSNLYPVKDRSPLKAVLESLDKATQSKVALEAKNGFGSTTSAPIARQPAATARKVKAKVKSETEGLKKIGAKNPIPKSPEEGIQQMKAEMEMKSKARSRRARSRKGA